jgi:hypothetical protein
MAKKRKRGRKWRLLFRFEGDQAVHLYEPLRKDDLKSRLRDGWVLID